MEASTKLAQIVELLRILDRLELHPLLRSAAYGWGGRVTAGALPTNETLFPCFKA